MAGPNAKDIEKLSKAIAKAISDSGYSSDSKTSSIAEANSLRSATATLINDDEIVQKLEKYKDVVIEVEKRTATVREQKEKIIDSEQIIAELEDEKLDRVKEQFKVYQQTYLSLLEIEKTTGSLTESQKEAKELLEKQIPLLAKQLELNKTQIEQKQKINSIARQLLQPTIQYGLELEKNIIALGKLTGGVQNFGEAFTASTVLSAKTLGSGITYSQSQAAIQGLASEFTNLIAYGASATSEMAQVTAQLEKVGVSNAIGAKSFDTLVNAMGKTPEQASKIQESFVQMAAKNKMALSAVVTAFQENSSRFVGYGKDMEKVLEGLAEQSLKTGVAIGKLVTIAQGFDTFEDAATKVGNLNALLSGDYFNSIELLTASDEERIKLLKDGVLASGMQWESMNRFQKMAIANAAGISDLNEAAKLFGANLTATNKTQAESAEVQKTLAEQAQNASLALDKLKSMFNGLLIVAQPFITIVMGAVNILSTITVGITNFASQFGDNAVRISSLLTSIGSAAALLLLKLGIGGVAGLFSKFGSWVAGLIPSFTRAAAAGISSGPGVRTLGSSIVSLFNSFARVPVTGIAKAALIGLILGGTIAAIAGSLALMKGVDPTLALSFAAVLLSVTAALFGLGALMKTGVGALLLGVGVLALLGIAAGIYALGQALRSFGGGTEKIASSFETLKSSITGMGSVTAGLSGAFSPIKSFVEGFNSLETAYMDAFTVSIERMAMALKNLDGLKDVKLTMVADLAENINANVTNSNATGASAVASSPSVTSKRERAPLIPASQTTTVVPMIVQIDKTKIIEILRKDIEEIASGQTTKQIDAIGLTQSGFNISNRLATS